MENLYCWKCKQVVSLLGEKEWLEIEPFLHRGLEKAKEHRAQTGAPIQEVPWEICYSEALAVYGAIPGVINVRPDQLWHHRRSEFGSICEKCGKPMRTSESTECYEC